MNLEDALVDLEKATDPRGAPVRLHSGGTSSSELRRSTLLLGSSMMSKNTVYFDARGTNPKVCEATAWENLAKLARATAAALREEA